MIRQLYLFIAAAFCFAQHGVEPIIGLQEVQPDVWALTNARIYSSPDDVIETGTILLRNGLIDQVGMDLTIPVDATEIDMSGMTIYPGFIESWYEVDYTDTLSRQNQHWNSLVHPESNAVQSSALSEKLMDELRKLGFTSVHLVYDKGIFRGGSGIRLLNEKQTKIHSNISQVIGFDFNGWGSNDYPGALLGTMALLRQTFYDAQWYGKTMELLSLDKSLQPDFREDASLEQLYSNLNNRTPFLFNTVHELYALRAVDIATEFNLPLWLKGSGYEYRRLKELMAVKPFIILPLKYPDKPDVVNPHLALSYSTEQLKHWALAEKNPAKLEENQIPFALTTTGLKKKTQFRKNLTNAIKAGLSETEALSALTSEPAKRFGLEGILGKIEQGYIANLVVTDGNYFDDKSKVKSVWVDGRPHNFKDDPSAKFKGNWEFNWNEFTGELHLKGKSGHLLIDSTDVKLKHISYEIYLIAFSAELDSIGIPGVTRFYADYDPNKLTGRAQTVSGDGSFWSASIMTDAIDEKKKDSEKEEIELEFDAVFPEGAFGVEQYHEPENSIMVKNATIWTSSKNGILEHHDIYIRNGLIHDIGKNLQAPLGTKVINGRGKHITPGLIDCHSHSAVSAINEGTQSITSEVRIRDVIDSDDIAIYRELAGGLTTINILHGSANTIGGQNAVLKLRWGRPPAELFFTEAPQGIKFALGENVKQSNWGDDYTTRYPQTRMGVEQILRDAFERAQEYRKNWIQYNDLVLHGDDSDILPPRRDLELDALVEIMEGTRLVHCHSYRQDEILMLTRVAEDFGFTIGTFQHVLEGYKVADRIAEHGAGASTFTDWWAYKYEVIDAIPYNGTLMHDVGVNVSFNSDSDELARRMNLEAAKAVKYGGTKREEALKFVTLNPAIQLGIDEWVGSLEIGKHADFVIWSGPPLSTSTICEQTWIEGTRYFSLQDDERMRKRDRKIRSDIIQKILKEPAGSRKGIMKPNGLQPAPEYHNCLSGDDDE